jgi:ABC-type Zn2+ transport system substrate-binding protein/surface adhesin
MQDNMVKCLTNMSETLHGGEYHMLVQKLLVVSEDVVESMNLREELSAALRDKESSKSGDCGHDHDHDHEHGHEHDHSHEHSHAREDGHTAVAGEGEPVVSDTGGVKGGDGGDSKR